MDDSRWTGSLLSFVCALYLSTSVVLGQGGERFSTVQLPKARVLKGILVLKGIPTEAFLEEPFFPFFFLLICFETALSRGTSLEEEADQGGAFTAFRSD
jgi:hypothetical protein